MLGVKNKNSGSTIPAYAEKNKQKYCSGYFV
jgi:hypothetical protein